MRKRIKNIFKKTSDFIEKYIDDILLVLGVGFISYGLFKIYIPIGFISIGIACIGYAFLFAKNRVERR